MIIAVLQLVPQTGKREAVVEILRFAEDHVRREKDCLQCGVVEATGAAEILYLEQWKTAKDLHAHIRSSLYLPILHAMELASEAPTISFHEVSGTESMELIEALRN